MRKYPIAFLLLTCIAACTPSQKRTEPNPTPEVQRAAETQPQDVTKTKVQPEISGSRPPAIDYPFWGYNYKTDNFGGALHLAERLTAVPDALSQKFSGKKFRVYTIDLDMDGKKDFIVDEISEENPDVPFRTCFVDSSFTIRNCGNLNLGTQYYAWFAALDIDPPMELFLAKNWEDGNIFSLYRLNPISWEPKKVFTFHPLLVSQSPKHEGVYSCPPGAVRDIAVKRSELSVKIRATMDHLFCSPFGQEPDDPCNPEENYSPAIYFKGESGDDRNVLREEAREKRDAYFTLKDLEALAQKKKTEIKARCKKIKKDDTTSAWTFPSCQEILGTKKAQE